MKHRPEGNESQQSFFHTMVVMGGALALGCGGLSTADGPPTIDNSAGTGGSGGTGTGSGGAAGSGGMTGTAGTGAIVIPDAGVPDPVEPGPFACSPAQWNCSSVGVSCHGDGYLLPESCPCEAARPKTPTDCAPGQAFLCREATVNHESRRFTEPVAFECTCAAQLPTCEATCDQIYESSRSNCHDLDDTSGHSVLCGCAVIVLR
ncbi:MAG TPA: hypothetical protein VGK73_40535 [Polyangiaceae bacterium]